MGNNCCSNEDDYDPFRKRPSRVETDGFSDIRVGSAIREDEQIVEVLRREFKETPQVFLLNNLLMCPQFFENHRKDRDQAPLTTNKIEKDLNTILLKNENMECICPDLPMEIINNNLRYRPLHGRKKHLSEPLIPKRMFVINNSIEVVNSMDVVQYTSIDKPAYQVRLEESSRKGFVRLKQIDTNKVPNIPINQDEPGPSGLQVPDSEYYEYTSITDLRTPKLLQTIEKLERRDTLPVTCFTSRKVKKPDHEIYDIENNSDSEFEFNEDNLFDTVIYIDAKGFMNYFKNALFPNSLGRSLGFTQDEIDLTRSIPGKMFCNLTDDDDNPLPCEVIPSVAIQWPAEQTFEFIMREDRPTITDKNTGIRYKWPTDTMITEMRTFNCMLIPKGYWMKKGQYSDATIEWEIAFPKAERYLEARMSHVQIRCYLFLLTLHKTFIDPVTQQHGLLIEHIKCHMYWECEANYRDWPEHRLGTKILKVIENLCQCLSKSELPDFFIKQKNHFRNIPKKYLHFAQKVLNEILQNPVVHFIKALRCIRYTSGKFYQPFEFKEFYRILIQTQGYKLVNPNIIPTLRKKYYADPEMQWRYLQEQARRKKILDDRKKEFGNFKDEEDTESVDSIDLDWNCEKQFEVFKTKLILCHFIKTFIVIAKDVFRFGGTENQCLLYLKQASYLTKLLEATSPGLIPEAREFQQQIYVEQEAFQRSAVLRKSNKPPETPIRNSLQFDFSMTQQLKSNAVNLNNLHNAYNSSGVKLMHTPSVKLKSSPILRLKSDVKNRKSVSFINPK